MLVRVSDGSVAQRIDYNENGRVVYDSNPGFQAYGFAGGIYDFSTSLVKFGVRWYDPSNLRWTTKDPIQFDGGDMNLYGYVVQDPINLIDSQGTNPFIIVPVVVVGGLIIGNEINDYVQDPFYALKRKEWLNKAKGWLGIKQDKTPCPPRSSPPENMPKPSKPGLPPPKGLPISPV